MLPLLISLLIRLCGRGGVLGLIPALALFGLALAPSRAPAQYRFDHWTADTGLPQNWVRDLVQTRDGYLWLATLGGLVRFDGQRLTVFTKVTHPEILSNRLTFLHEDRAGNLWIGTEQGGVLRYRDGAFTSWTTADGLPGNYVDHIDEDEAGAILIFTEQGAVQWRDEKFTKLPLTAPEDNISGYLGPQGGYGRYLTFALRPAATGYQLFHRGQWEYLPNPPGVPAGVALPVNTRKPWLKPDARGRLWFHWRNLSGYYARRGGQWEVTLAPPMRGVPFYLDQQGRYWTMARTGVALERDGKTTPLAVRGVEWYYRVLEDREGNCWLGTYDQGLFRVSEQAVSLLELPGPPAERYVYPLLEDRHGNVWISAGGAGLTRYANGKLTRFPLHGAQLIDAQRIRRATDISSFCEDADGSLLVGTYEHGITRWRNNEWRVDAELSARIKARVDVIFRDRQGHLWFGGQNGLDRRDTDGQWTHYGPDNGLPTQHVKTVLEDSAGGLWIGGYGCLALWRDNRFSAWTKNEGLNADRVIALYEDSARVLWVGTSDGGLYRCQLAGDPLHLTRYTTREGLHANSVEQIFEDERGYLWLGSEQGIYRLHKGELNDFAAGRTAFVTSIPFNKADGLLSVECIGGFQPAGFKGRDGRLWFPTQEGVAIVDPRRVTTNAVPPPVLLEECWLDRQAVDCRQGVRVKPGQSDLEIRYTGLSFNRPEKVRFRYRLEGLNADWIEAGTRRSVYYSHLPPGDYTFHVIAANSDGVWNTEGQSLRIVVLPPFYRTWWFLTLAGLGAAGLSLLAYNYRIRQLERARVAQQELSRRLIDSQEGERKRIAVELHDSLGQQLLVIKNWAMIGQNVAGNERPAHESFDEISNAASQAIDEVREIIYDLRPYQLDKIGLTSTIRFMIEKVATVSGIEFRTELDEIDGLFSDEAEIRLYRVVQECVNNIVKHSQASAARVVIRRDKQAVRLRIEDNGRGFAPEAQAGDGAGRGLGLTGLGERVRMLGGRYTIQSAPGGGTQVQVSIDLYADSLKR